MFHQFSISDSGITGTTKVRRVTFYIKKIGQMPYEITYDFHFDFETGEYDYVNMRSIENISDCIEHAVEWVISTFNATLIVDSGDPLYTPEMQFEDNVMSVNHPDIFYIGSLIRRYVNTTPALNDGGFIKYTSISFSPISI